jgi:cytochrome d ubiquinol oxidase subunit II
LERLLSWRTTPVITAGLLCFAGSAWAVWTRRYGWCRWFAAGEISLVLWGWGMAQYPYLVYPDLLLTDVAAPPATLRFVVLSLPFGAVLLIPALGLLFRVFKAEGSQSL